MPFEIGSVAIHDDGQHIGNAKRGVASGVASLDLASHVPDTQNPPVNTTHIAAAHPHSGHILSSNGQYAGNNTVNRAIPHGLGVTPKFISMAQNNPGTGVMILHMVVQSASVIYTTSVSDLNLTVTGVDDTNFYVGNATNYGASGNGNGINYIWFALS